MARTAVRARADLDGAAPVGARPVVAELERLCQAMTAHLGLSGAAVALMSPEGLDGVVAASDERCRQVDEQQFTTGGGPCHDAYAARRPVLVDDLAAPGERRWPGYRSAALEAGFSAVFAFPIQVDLVGLGVLDAFSEQPRHLDPLEALAGEVFADLALESLLLGGVTTEDGDLSPALGGALAYRDQIFQAQGMLSVSLGSGLPEALLRLRGHAFSHGLPLLDVARDVVAGDLTLVAEGR